MNIQTHLQKRLQLRPCHLCVFHKYCKRELSWQKHSSERKVFPKSLTQVTANIHEAGTLNWRAFAGGSWFWEPPIMQQKLLVRPAQKKSQRKRLILINYSAKIFEMANINVRKRQTSSVNYSLSIAREETPRQAKPEAAAPPKSSTQLCAGSKQLTRSYQPPCKL